MGGRTLCHSQRLVIRELTTDDVDALHAVYGDREAMRFVDDGEPLDRATCARWVEVTHDNYVRRGYGMSAIVSARDDEVLGFIGLVHPGGQDEPEIKYALRRDHWGRGLASEAVAALRDHGRRIHGLDTIIATVQEDHVASRRVLAKAGFVPDGVRAGDDGPAILVLRWRASDAGGG